MKTPALAALVSTVALFSTVSTMPAFAGETLTALLAGVADAERLEAPLVGEGKAEIDGIKGKVEDRVTIVERSAADAKAPNALLVAFDKAQTRMLSLGPAALQLATGGKAKTAGPDQQVAPSSFSAE